MAGEMFKKDLIEVSNSPVSLAKTSTKRIIHRKYTLIFHWLKTDFESRDGIWKLLGEWKPFLILEREKSMKIVLHSDLSRGSSSSF